MSETNNRFFIDKNLLNDVDREDSLSGRFYLIINYYKTKNGCWNYSRGRVYRKSDDKEICDIKRNYSTFHHSFVEKNDQEWLITGRSYMSQTIVNLDTGEEFNPSDDIKDSFCWAECSLSPDGNTLLVDGCYWAAPYEYKFYDFTDPSKGWKKLNLDINIETGGTNPPSWIDNNTVECHYSEEFYLPLNKFESEVSIEEVESEGERYDEEKNFVYLDQIKTTLRRVDNNMVIVDRWSSDDMKKKIEDNQIRSKKFNEWKHVFKKHDDLYKVMREYIDKYNLPAENCQCYGMCYVGWSETSDGTERKISQEFKGTNTIRLSWGVDKDLIKVEVYKKGKKHDTTWFGHNIEGMRNAMDFVKDNINENVIKNALRFLSQIFGLSRR